MKGLWIWILAGGCGSCGMFYVAAGRYPAYAAEQKAAGQAQPLQNKRGPAAAVAATSSSDAFETTVKPMVRANCIACHNPVKLKGDLIIERFLTMSRSGCTEGT